MPTDNETYMHYCEGTWRQGFVLDCEHAEDHKVKLVQSRDHYRAAVEHLEGRDIGGEG